MEFVSCIQTNSKPPTPSASTPYRQLKRHHFTQVTHLFTTHTNTHIHESYSLIIQWHKIFQPFDEMGRRISSAMSSTIGLRLFSELNDGTGHTAVELLLDTWIEDGVENSSEILKVCATHIHTLVFANTNRVKTFLLNVFCVAYLRKWIWVNTFFYLLVYLFLTWLQLIHIVYTDWISNGNIRYIYCTITAHDMGFNVRDSRRLFLKRTGLKIQDSL